jgi:hypothetical protein
MELIDDFARAEEDRTALYVYAATPNIDQAASHQLLTEVAVMGRLSEAFKLAADRLSQIDTVRG